MPVLLLLLPVDTVGQSGAVVQWSSAAAVSWAAVQCTALIHGSGAAVEEGRGGGSWAAQAAAGKQPVANSTLEAGEFNDSSLECVPVIGANPCTLHSPQQ